MGQRKGPTGRGANRWAAAGSWVSAVVFVTVGILAADLILGAPTSGRAFAGRAVGWAVPAALAGLVTVLLARRSGTRWAWWRYPGTVAPIGLVLVAAVSLSGIDLPGEDPREQDVGRVQAEAGQAATQAAAPTPATAATPTPTPTAPTPTSPPPTADQGPDMSTKLKRPAKVAGLELVSEPGTERTAQRFAAQVREKAPATKPLVAFYQDPSADDRLVVLSGASGAFGSEDKYETIFKALDEVLPVPELHEVYAGPLGGWAGCGSDRQRGAEGTVVPMTVCSWDDYGSVVRVAFFNRPLEESAKLLLRIRSGVETGGWDLPADDSSVNGQGPGR